MSLELDDLVQDHEKRITKIEIDGARLDERLDALVSSTNNLKWGLWGFTLLMLLALIWQAIGPSGFRAVTQAANPVVHITE